MYQEIRKLSYALIAILVLLGGFFAFQKDAAQAAVGINKKVNFQGKVTNTDGTNVSTASYNFLFCIYTTASPATACTAGANNDAVWRESKSLTVTDGIFQTNLGDTTTLPGSVDFNSDNIFLGINFNSNGQMSPLVQFTASPYSFNSDLLDGGDWAVPGAIGSTTRNSALFTTIGANGDSTLASTAGATLTLGNSTGAATVASGGTSSWTNASGNLTFSTTASGILALTSAGALNLTAGASSTVTLPNVANALNYDANTLSIDALNNRVGIGTNAPDAKLSVVGGEIWMFNDANNPRMIIGDNGSAGQYGYLQWDSANNYYRIETDGTNGLKIKGNNVSIGDLFPDAPLRVGNGSTQLLTVKSDGHVGIGTNTSPSAYLDITAPTTAAASLRLEASAGVDPSAPNIGDMWFNGTGLFFRKDGSTSQDLLVSGGSGYSTIKDESTSLTQRSTLAFLGSGINCLDNSGQTECTVSSGGAGPWTDGTGISYLTDTAEDLAIGGNSLAAPFSVDVSTNTTRIGSGTGSNGKLDMYASDGDTGSITYTDNDTWAFEGGRVAIGANTISDGASSERMLQVGSEANRGNLATYGEIISKGLNRHTALANIKDIYVYDTTGDSDGGRWIDWATTDNLSWYSEGLDDGPNDPCNIATDDRCYSNPFPRKAILVVTTSALYIFDAATNDLWMKFEQNAAGYALGVDTNNDPSSVTALNGVIYVGTNGSAGAGVNGLYAIDFVNDRLWNYNGTNRSAADVGISARNSALNYNVDSDTKLEISPVGTAAEWERVNDVHAVVMSRTQSAVSALGTGASTNPGYGKIFIALATDAGVTIINPSARVLNQYSDVTSDDYTAVTLSTRGFLYALNTTQDQLERWDAVDIDKVGKVNGAYTRKWDETIGTGPALASSAFNIIAGAPDNLEIAERASIHSNLEDVIYVGHSLGLAELHDFGSTTPAFGWVKYYNSTRQTPMMMLAGINDMVLPMDDTSGTQAQDLAIANTDMAIKGAPTLGVNGVQGKAINFDNTDDYLCSDANQDNVCDVDTAFNMSTVGWTLSLWFKHSATAPASGADTIFEKCVTAAPGKGVGCVAAYMATNGTVVVANDIDGVWTRPDEGAASYNITATSTYAYNDNQWHNLIITRTSASDVDSWIDGQGMNLSTATAGATTFDGSQIVTIGASCVLTVTANCGAVTNVWDGQIDDVQYIVGTTTQATMTQLYVRRYFNVERPRASKRTFTVTDATSATSTSITDTGLSALEQWYPNELAGLIVEVTGSDDADCVGITRRISSNTATSINFTPAVPGTCTLDASTDFQVDSEALYGAANSVAGVGITAETPLGEARQLCVGTNDTTDGGGVTCYNHQDGPSIVADQYHGQASQTDDNGTDWTGTNYDDMRAVDLSTRTMVMASEGHFTSVTEDVRLGQGLDYISNQLYAIRQEIVLDGITAVGSTGSEVGFTGGADLAEYYKSTEPLEAGTIVATGDDGADSVKKTSGKYQKDVLGIVATAPGIILGAHEEDSYPVALAGRVPMNITTENGMIAKGDQVTSSSLLGYGMVAIETGRVIGTVLEDPNMETFVDCPVDSGLPIGIKCGQVTVFVNLMDFTGMRMEDLMSKKGYDALAQNSEFSELFASANTQDIASQENEEVFQSQWTDIFKAANTLGFLKKLNDPANGANMSSEILAKNIYASGEVVSPLIVTDTLIAKHIKAESIEGLEFIQTGIDSANDGVANNASEVKNLGQQIKDLQGSVDLLDEKNKITNENVDKNLKIVEGLSVEKEAEFKGFVIFRKMVEFIDKVVFRNDVEFEGQVVFNKDTAGYAVIKEGTDSVEIAFEKEYATPPIINASLSLQSIKNDELRKAAEQLLLVSDVKFIITNVTTKGLEIRISQKALSDIPFSWQAIAIKDVKTFESKIPVLAVDKKELFGGPETVVENVDVLPVEQPVVQTETQNVDEDATTLLSDIQAANMETSVISAN